MFGVLLCLVGAVFFVQGLNVIHGSTMSGHAQWAVIGGVMFAAGVALLAWAWRLRALRRQEAAGG